MLRPNRVNISARNPGNKKLGKYLSWIFLICLFVGGAYLAYRGIVFAQNIGINLSPVDIIQPVKKDPEIKKDSTGQFTNVLLIGIDTRPESNEHQNTDTIMVVSYNHSTNETVMISIPRDFWVKIPERDRFIKVNSIYILGEREPSASNGNGARRLKEVATRITGLEIQYHVVVDLAGFTKVVDTLGGIQVDVERSFVDEKYPSETPGLAFEYVSFEKGLQNMDGKTALRFARSRYSRSEEGSDFARARRQQKIVTGLKEKAVSSETFFNPQKVLELLGILEGHVKLSDFSLEDIQAAINLAKKVKDSGGKSYSFVLDPSLGNKHIMQELSSEEAGYHIKPVLGLEDYSDVHKYLRSAIANPGMYLEKPIIFVYDVGVGDEIARERFNQLREKYPLIDIRYLGTLLSDKEGIIVYDHTADSLNLNTIKSLTRYLQANTSVKPIYITNNLNGEEVTVLFGKDIPPVDFGETQISPTQ